MTALSVMSGELLTLAICASKAFRWLGSSGVKAAIRTPSGPRMAVEDLRQLAVCEPIQNRDRR
jgi:hypothetical protein